MFAVVTVKQGVHYLATMVNSINSKGWC